MPRVERRPSPIAGHGLFATEPIPAGSSVPHVDVELLNHSCAPNLGWSGGTLVALAEIDLDAELTIDYATFHTEAGFAMFCHCETYRCRQVIEGDDWQIPQLQRRYAGHLAPDVQRLIDSLG